MTFLIHKSKGILIFNFKTTCSIVICWFGFPMSIIMSLAFVKLNLAHKNISEELSDLPMDLFYSSSAACLNLLGQVFINISLQYESPTKVSIAKTSDVLFTAVLQYYIINQTLGILNIAGALSILIGTSFVLVFRILEEKYENYILSAIQKNNKSHVVDTLESDKNENENLLVRRLLKIVFVKI
jgi:drug/metabolite transporter (DMT)-like permease